MRLTGSTAEWRRIGVQTSLPYLRCALDVLNDVCRAVPAPWVREEVQQKYSVQLFDSERLPYVAALRRACVLSGITLLRVGALDADALSLSDAAMDAIVKELSISSGAILMSVVVVFSFRSRSDYHIGSLRS